MSRGAMAPVRDTPPHFAPTSDFARELQGEVAAYLREARRAGRPATGDPRLLVKAGCLLVWFGASYGALLAAPTWGMALVAAVSLAFAAAALGFGVFHDANHATLFRHCAANRQAARLCSVLLGPSRAFWRIKHQVFHHRSPNVTGWDDDVDARGFLRLTPDYPWAPRFRHQQVQACLFYGLNTIEWFFWKDFACLVRGRLNRWQEARLSRGEQMELILGKALYFALMVAPPFLLLPLPWALGAFVLFHFVFSWVLTAVFQLAHLTPGMSFGDVYPGDDWAMHQMRTTANFATRSRWITWFTGGLNHQIEHHLFPQVAHTHYPALRPIVRKAAVRHGLPYHDLGSMRSALRQHFALLRRLGAG